MSYYQDLKDDVHNVSYWFPKVENCGIRVPQTFIKTVPEEIMFSFFMEKPDDMDKIYEWVKNELMPEIPMELKGLIFIKNGAFSNKFDFNTCAVVCNALNVTRAIIEINYASLMFETSGNAEIVIRERIDCDTRKVPCIYHGMPLRNEYRVFYDFDSRKACYIVNYWDWAYCHEGISRDATDKIVYESVYSSLQEHYEQRKDEVMKLVEDHMKEVDLSGVWSVDILEDEAGNFWLIDMALGYRSAYWDKEKVEAVLQKGE